MTAQLEYINHLLQYFPIMLALCLMFSVTYYAQNYAGIIGWSLVYMCVYVYVCVCVCKCVFVCVCVCVCTRTRVCNKAGQ